MLETNQETQTSSEEEGNGRLVFFLVAWVVTLFVALYLFPGDDGLRHVGHAFHPSFRSWGDVYPFSILEQHGDIDPWLGHDLTLRGLAYLTSALPISRLAAAVILTKLLTIAFIATLLGLALRRSRIADAINNGAGIAVALAVVALLLSHTVVRVSAIRPFAYGAMFVLFAVGRTSFSSGFWGATTLLFLYPYLAWIYTLPVAVAHALRGSRRFAVGVVIPSIATIGLQSWLYGASFWQLLFEIARSGTRRAQIPGLAIGELGSVLDNPMLYGFFFVALLLLAPRLFAGLRSRRLRAEELMLLFFLPPALLHVRYLLDLILPLLLVCYGREVVAALAVPCARWAGSMALLLRGKDVAVELQQRPSRPNVVIRGVLAVGFTACLLGILALSYRQYTKLSQQLQQLASIPRGSLVLTEFNLQYRLLFVRPDLRVIPSPELGFWRPDIAEAYRSFFNDGDLCGLARAVKAGFYVESKRMYLDPLRVDCLTRRVSESSDISDALRIWPINTR